MKRMPFERPTEHYDERLFPIDEQLCALLKQRKDLSNDPGYPPFEYITKWAADYGFYDDYLKVFFSTLIGEQHYRPQVEPAGFRTLIPVLRSAQHGPFFYTVTSIRQYGNASVLTFAADWDVNDERESLSDRPRHFELSVGEKYDCRFESGGGSTGHSAANYVISPPLPDDLSGLAFVFKESGNAFKQRRSSVEIVIEAE
ncbi:hypothetical protein GZH47_19530 [Paenibacillus rhizovicinus]|uniref:Uncharacterized protein n=1 Tax=Paenibacillus rhizovicinus TaxID=2704463 RepID=A0A6C0P362_9BACL|nr:hypothetical protein [Paenibacillus rhizovicinus]QHW32781.1 hypothetical protein GZH47_19530 [Paenibacillus rhizovicinus]